MQPAALKHGPLEQLPRLHGRTEAFGFWRVRHGWRLLQFRLQNKRSILRSAFRSALGHIRIQDTRDIPAVDLGPALQSTVRGELVPDTRTSARSSCIRKLLARYPWADTVDIRIFLMGFDEGEKWRARSPSKEVDTGSSLSTRS